MNKKQKNRFANAVICVCLAVCIVITAAVIWEYHRLDQVMPSGVLAALLGLWGGELLIVALRQVFGRAETRKKQDEESI